MTTTATITTLSDEALLQETERLAALERGATTALLRALREVDARRLYLAEGYSCMFFYCTKRLHLSEHAAYNRIEVARASRAVPGVLDALQTGALTLTTARLLAPHLTRINEREVLDACAFKSRREVERYIAERFGRAEEPAGYKIQFTADQDTYDKLCQAQALMRHQNPYGLIAPIVNKALTLLIADIERHRLGLVGRPRRPAKAASADSRYVPTEVRRTVWKRDGGQCAFVGSRGRCGERGRLEFHHVQPFAEGGLTTVENIQLRCRAHNVYEWELASGAH